MAGPLERSAVQCLANGGPIRYGVAGATMPAGVSAAAVSEAGDVPDEDLIRPEGVAVGAACRWVGDPPPSRGLYQFAKHDKRLVGTGATAEQHHRHGERHVVCSGGTLDSLSTIATWGESKHIS